MFPWLLPQLVSRQPGCFRDFVWWETSMPGPIPWLQLGVRATPPALSFQSCAWEMDLAEKTSLE